MERVRIQHCHSCNSKHTENIFYTKTGDPVAVYVRCAECGTFVAKYILQSYAGHKSYDSYLTSIKGQSASGRKTLKDIKKFDIDIQLGYDKVLKLLEDKGEEEIEITRMVEKKDDDSE